jgi:hypothetical protein
VVHVTPRSLAEALAQCKANGVDLRVSGRGFSACADLMSPFCDGNISSDPGPEGLPTCLGVEPIDPRKAAVLLREAEARANAGKTPWLLIGGGVAAAGLVVWLLTRG